MAANEDSGVFDVGTFGNAQFDTIEQPSTVSVFSQETRIINVTKIVDSTVNVFSDLGREIQRDLASFVGTVQSTVNVQRQILREINSFTSVFSISDFRIGKKVISTIKAASKTDITASLFRNPASTIKVNSQIRIIFELVKKSTVKVASENNFTRIFNRFTESSLKLQSKIGEILRNAPDLSPPFEANVRQSFKTFIEDKT